MDQFVGEIRSFGFNFAPVGWALCNGQILPIAQNTALFSLLGTNYGGDGRSTFALPNLQARVATCMGQGPGLSPYPIGQVGGEATVTLLTTQIPAHTHTLPVSTLATSKSSVPSPGVYLGATGRGTASAYATAAQGQASPTSMAPSGANAGTGLPHNNMAPYLVCNFCIALTGIFPPRS